MGLARPSSPLGSSSLSGRSRFMGCCGLRAARPERGLAGGWRASLLGSCYSSPHPQEVTSSHSYEEESERNLGSRERMRSAERCGGVAGVGSGLRGARAAVVCLTSG